MTMQDERPRIEVREPLTYTEDAPRSYFRDLVMSQCFRDDDATSRLEQHGREMRFERAAADSREQGRLERTTDGQGVEYRVNPNSTLGTGGEFDVPLWLVAKFASAGRAGRPLGDLLQPMMLPPGVQSIHTPRMTTGTAANTSIDGGAVQNQDVVTTDAFSNVVTISGEATVSQQLLDLSPIGLDAAWYLDLNRAYNRTLESQLLYGSPGATTQQPGQLLGLASVQGIPAGNTVAGGTFTTIATLWPGLGQVYANVGNNRLLPLEHWLLTPRRWAFIASSVDSSNRPIASPGNGYNLVADVTGDAFQSGGVWSVGPLLHKRAWEDGAIPIVTLTEDIWALRPSDMFLWESAPRTITAVNPSSGTLQVTLSLHRYVAFIGNRYPSGIGRISGLPAPANF